MQVWIFGDSLRDHIIGFVVVDPDRLKKHCQEIGAATNDEQYDKLLETPALKQTVFESLIELANENKLNSLERPKQLQLLREPWTPENGILTPTMKIKRNIAKTEFAEQIAQLYAAPVLVAPKKK